MTLTSDAYMTTMFSTKNHVSKENVAKIKGDTETMWVHDH